MRKVKTIGIVISFISFATFLGAQDRSYLSSLENTFTPQMHEHHYSHYVKDAKNPLDFIFGALYLSYKTFISSQDMESCVFHPSCSTYAIESIQKKGYILGVINAFDRLTRCHPFAGPNYPYDEKSQRLYDPVD
ncbi:MAG TPA: membrane protein insertion efficiency factor YidD [Saprospiraceae bacterium]|nr:membrane protein insertion efficiency factor YidD [Saprospiraceae bacterium]